MALEFVSTFAETPKSSSEMDDTLSDWIKDIITFEIKKENLDSAGEISYATDLFQSKRSKLGTHACIWTRSAQPEHATQSLRVRSDIK